MEESMDKNVVLWKDLKTSLEEENSYFSYELEAGEPYSSLKEWSEKIVIACLTNFKGNPYEIIGALPDYCIEWKKVPIMEELDVETLKNLSYYAILDFFDTKLPSWRKEEFLLRLSKNKEEIKDQIDTFISNGFKTIISPYLPVGSQMYLPKRKILLNEEFWKLEIKNLEK